MFFPRQRIRDVQTGQISMYLTTAVDATSTGDGKLVAVYSPEDDPHAIYVCALGEFATRFEAAPL